MATAGECLPRAGGGATAPACVLEALSKKMPSTGHVRGKILDGCCDPGGAPLSGMGAVTGRRPTGWDGCCDPGDAPPSGMIVRP